MRFFISNSVVKRWGSRLAKNLKTTQTRIVFSLNSFLPNVPFWSPWKHQKTKDVFMGIKRKHWEEKGSVTSNSSSNSLRWRILNRILNSTSCRKLKPFEINRPSGRKYKKIKKKFIKTLQHFSNQKLKVDWVNNC